MRVVEKSELVTQDKQNCESSNKHVDNKSENFDTQALPDARVLWGRTLLAIKKANKTLLHTVCVNLGKIELRGNTLVVFVPNTIDYTMLQKPQNSSDLVESLHNLGYNVNIEFVLDEDIRESFGSKLDKLRKILGADIQEIN